MKKIFLLSITFFLFFSFPLFAQNKIIVIPDILANSAGVAGSYLEWYQNIHNEKWTEQQVLDKLHGLMSSAFTEVFAIQQKYKTTFRNAAFVLAINRIAQAMKDRGI